MTAIRVIPLHTARRRQLQLAERIDAFPPALWLALQALALWPSLAWSARRLADGSDEPLGLAALALLALAAATGRIGCRHQARVPWLLAAVTFTVGATLLPLPPLALAVLAALALACALAAFRADGAPWLPLAGLLLLALPVIASLQFYAGWPLRIVTAEASRWLLGAAGVEVLRDGASLLVAGREVLVDAPCSGVQLAWLGYCAACAAALWQRLPDARFAARLPLVGLLVLAGNVLRNSALVAIEAGVVQAPAFAHEAVGLGVLALVVLPIVRLMCAADGGADAHHRR